LVSVLLIGVISYRTSDNLLRKQVHAWVNTYAQKTGEIMITSITHINSYLDDIVYDDDFLVLTKGMEYGQVSFGQIHVLCEEMAHSIGAGEFSVLSVEVAFRTADNPWLSRDTRVMLETIDQTRWGQEDALWYPNGDRLCIIRSIWDHYNNEKIGRLIVSLDKADFFSKVINSSDTNYSTLVTFDHTSYVYIALGKGMVTGAPNVNVVKNADDGIFYYNGEVYVTSNYEMKPTQLTIFNIISYQNIRREMSNIVASSLLVTLLCVLFILLISFLMSSSFTRRIDKIVQQMRQVGRGKFMVEFSDVRGDEIGQLQSVFTNLVDRLDGLVHDVCESRIIQNDLKLKALQAQINPHFLFNCLDNLNWHAIMHGDDRANQIITQLSDFYRTSLNMGKGVTTVRQEILNVQSYMSLQLVLHDDSFDFVLDVPEELMDYMTVNLVLQPILENALNHGIDKIEDEERGLISLKGSRQGDTLVFRTFNSGPPISADVVETVLLKKKKGYGLNNVNERIKLVFGEEYGIRIYPRDKGTECVMVIPARYEAEGETIE
jgi:two-component system sensor histidine kinase YesM